MANEEEESTQLITRLDWLKPVGSVDQLPTEDVNEGAMCFVEAEGDEEVWQFKSGTWIRIDML